jgi:hypothetical protein
MRSAAVRAILKFLSKTKHYPSVVAKILENRSAHARTSALRKSRINNKARSHVGGAFIAGAGGLEFLGILEQFDHAFEQTAGAAAVDASMIEA